MVIEQFCDLLLFVLFHYKVIIFAQMFNHPPNLSIEIVSQPYSINLCRVYNGHSNFSPSQGNFLIVIVLVIASFIHTYTNPLFFSNLPMILHYLVKYNSPEPVIF